MRSGSQTPSDRLENLTERIDEIEEDVDELDNQLSEVAIEIRDLRDRLDGRAVNQ